MAALWLVHRSALDCRDLWHWKGRLERPSLLVIVLLPAGRPQPTLTRRTPSQCDSCRVMEEASSPKRHKRGYPVRRIQSIYRGVGSSKNWGGKGDQFAKEYKIYT